MTIPKQKSMAISSLRMEFEDLESKHKRFSKKCKYHGKHIGYPKQNWNQCALNNRFMGENENTNCGLTNCPLMGKGREPATWQRKLEKYK